MNLTTEYLTKGMKPEELILTDVLLELGAPDHLDGYPMTVEAVMCILEAGPRKTYSVMELYRELGCAFDIDPQRVERRIRFFIEKTWNVGNQSELQQYFRNTISPDTGNPTNKQFVCRLANIVRAEIGRRACEVSA